MIEIRVNGTSALDSEMTETLVGWLAWKLGIDNYLRWVTVELDYVSPLALPDDDAQMNVESDGNFRPREFSIDVKNGMSLYKTIICVCHEMVHVADLATGLWKQESPTKFSWAKKSYVLSETDYMERPWEVKAFGMEKILADQFCDAFKIKRGKYE